MNTPEVIAGNLDVWTSALASKAGVGRGREGGLESYGIKKLRELILELAVRGKLVDQDDREEPAEKLLEGMLGGLNCQKRKSTETVNGEFQLLKQQFVQPSGWAWVSLSDLGEFSGGKTPSKAKARYWGGETPWVTPKDMKTLTISSAEDSVTDAAIADGLRLHQQGAVLFVVRSGILRRSFPVAITSIECTVNQDLKVLAPHCTELSRYIQLIMQGFEGHILRHLTKAGMTVESIKFREFSTYQFPLPPLSEQHRIVAKVDELMALCDRLENRQADSQQAHQTLVETLLGTLTRTETAEELAEAWQRIAHHFDTLFATEQSIDQFRQAILQLAVMGKLVPQDLSAESAGRFLQKVAAEKMKLIDSGVLKKEKALEELSDDEIPFAVPASWKWIRFESLANEIATGPFGSMVHKSDYIEDGVPLINPSHMINGRIVEESSVSVSEIKANELSTYRLRSGDIVMARRGEMGRCAVVTPREQEWLCGTGSFVLRFHEAISRKFLLLVFSTHWVRTYLGGESVGATMTNLNHGILKKLPFCLPPVEEQHRIVAKVDELMALCDRLQARLADARTTQCHLADAIVEQAVA